MTQAFPQGFERMSIKEPKASLLLPGHCQAPPPQRKETATLAYKAQALADLI